MYIVVFEREEIQTKKRKVGHQKKRMFNHNKERLL